MKSGDPMRILRLLRDLYILDESDDLKGKEKEIMDQAKKFLCDEIAFVREASKIQVMETINEALRQMYKKKIAKDKERAKKSGTGLPLGILGYAEDESEEEELVLEEGEELDRALDEPVRRKKPAKKKSTFGDDEDEEDEEEEEVVDEDESEDSDDDDDDAPKAKKKR
jgi:hypothetical protein